MKLKLLLLGSLFFLISFFQLTFAKAIIIYMDDNHFTPSNITVPSGQTVTWVNRGHHVHTVTSSFFDSGRISPGKSVNFTFKHPGTYHYKCTLHSLLFFGMRGTITVK